MKIFGPDIGDLKVKTTCNKSARVELDATPILSSISEMFWFVATYFGILFVNEIPFSVFVSTRLNFATVKALSNREYSTIISSIKSIKATYHQKCFIVNPLSSKNKFKSVPQQPAGMSINIHGVARDEHVHQIERHIRTLKDQ